MKAINFVPILFILFIYVNHADSARKCFPVTATAKIETSVSDSGTSTTQSQSETSTQSTTASSSTNLTSYNYTELASNISNLQAQIDTQLEYSNGNFTAADQTNATIVAQINTLLADSSTSPDVVALLNQLSAILVNGTLTTSNTGTRKKRQATTSALPSTPCSDANATALNVRDAITVGTLLIDFNNKWVNSLTLINNNLISKSNSNLVVNSLTLNIQTYTNQINQVSLGFSNINSLNAQLLSNYTPIVSKICSLNLGPCGTFVSYNPLTNPNEPVERAFSAGNYLDETLSYVGIANLTNCGSDTFIPGRATISGNLQGPGVYVLCNDTEQLATNSVAYLQNHYDLTWVRADQNNVSIIPNAIKIKGDGNSNGLFIGRVNLTYENSTIIPILGGNSSLPSLTSNKVKRQTFNFNFTLTPITTNYTQVAKIFNSIELNVISYADSNQVRQSANIPFEVLTCKSSTIDNLNQLGTSINSYSSTATSYITAQYNLLLAEYNAEAPRILYSGYDYANNYIDVVKAIIDSFMPIFTTYITNLN